MKIATRWAPVLANRDTVTKRITRRNVVLHQEHTTWNANVRTETAGTEAILRLMAPNIAKTSQMEVQKQSLLSSNKQKPSMFKFHYFLILTLFPSIKKSFRLFFIKIFQSLEYNSLDLELQNY